MDPGEGKHYPPETHSVEALLNMQCTWRHKGGFRFPSKDVKSIALLPFSSKDRAKRAAFIFSHDRESQSPIKTLCEAQQLSALLIRCNLMGYMSMCACMSTHSYVSVCECTRMHICALVPRFHPCRLWCRVVQTGH